MAIYNQIKKNIRIKLTPWLISAALAISPFGCAKQPSYLQRIDDTPEIREIAASFLNDKVVYADFTPGYSNSKIRVNGLSGRITLQELKTKKVLFDNMRSNNGNVAFAYVYYPDGEKVYGIDIIDTDTGTSKNIFTNKSGISLEGYLNEKIYTMGGNGKNEFYEILPDGTKTEIERLPTSIEGKRKQEEQLRKEFGPDLNINVIFDYTKDSQGNIKYVLALIDKGIYKIDYQEYKEAKK